MVPKLRSRSGLVLFAMLLCLLSSCEGVRRSFRRNGSERQKNKALYIFLAVFLGVSCVCCMYICRRICPDGPVFSALELDDIRIGRVAETESSLQQQIESLQNRLTVNRMKRTKLETRRDIAQKVEERIESFNAKGSAIYGPAWEGTDGGTLPIKELVSIPENEFREMRIEAQNIITARKAEEERDLWKMWNNYKTSVNENTSAGKSSARSHDGQPDVLTGRASRTTKATAAVVDARFSSSQIASAAPSLPLQAIPPPRQYTAPPASSSVGVTSGAAAKGLRPTPTSAGLRPKAPFRQNVEEKDDSYENTIHSSFHSPSAVGKSEKTPLLSGALSSGAEAASSRPPPPSGPPPGRPPAKLASLLTATTPTSSSNKSDNAASPPFAPPGVLAPSSTPPLQNKPGGRSIAGPAASPPFAPSGVLPPRGTPPPAALRSRGHSGVSGTSVPPPPASVAETTYAGKDKNF